MASVLPRKNKNGTVTWRVMFRIGGRQAQESFTNEKAAREFGRMVDRVGGEAARQVLAARQGKGASMPTLKEFTERYLDADSGLLTGIEDGTRHDYAAIAERSFLVPLGELPVDVITKTDVGRWIAWQERQPSTRRKGQTVSAKTIKNYHALLSAVMACAIEQKLRTDNPARGSKWKSDAPREPVFLTPDEIERILEHLHPRFHPFVRFLVASGCRWGEATALQWGDIDRNVNPPTVRISRAWKKAPNGRVVLGPPKSKKGRRTIAVWKEVIDDLGTPGAPSGMVFRNEAGGRLWHAAFANRHWTPAVKASGIGKSPSIHDLRHTSASLLIAQGVPLPFIQARLGHEKITTTVDTYGHLVPDAHQEMAAAMQAALGPRFAQPVKVLAS